MLHVRTEKTKMMMMMIPRYTTSPNLTIYYVRTYVWLEQSKAQQSIAFEICYHIRFAAIIYLPTLSSLNPSPFAPFSLIACSRSLIFLNPSSSPS